MPIKAEGKIQINKEVARKRAVEEKKKTETLAKGQATQGSLAKKEKGKAKVVSSVLKGKEKRMFEASDLEGNSSASKNTHTEKE